MPLSRSRDYLSIGEVLDAVRTDYPDVSISKIRFLETEGLISPERTPSGYRKFYEGDVKRLRYVLSLQKEHFLPLKVIKERLKTGQDVASPPAAPAPADTSDEPIPDLTGGHFTREELQKASGLESAQLANLEDFGLLNPGPTGAFDENDLLLATAFGGFFRYGAEARHLKMYKQFADRESAFFEQIVAPVARKKDPEGSAEAGRNVQQLAGLSRKVRDALMRKTLREIL
jgi:DNA-binding transcriptional MerR regulator